MKNRVVRSVWWHAMHHSMRCPCFRKKRLPKTGHVYA